MNKIIRLSKAFLIGLFVFILCYLISCYANASFDIIKHSNFSRAVVSILGLFTFINCIGIKKSLHYRNWNISNFSEN